MPLISELKETASRLKRDTFALYLAARHPRTPWYAKALAAGVAAYAFSPIDLIPDFIPVLGYLDDLILVPLGIAAAVHLVPQDVMAECRERADEQLAGGRPVSRTVAAIIVALWLAVLALVVAWLFRILSP